MTTTSREGLLPRCAGWWLLAGALRAWCDSYAAPYRFGIEQLLCVMCKQVRETGNHVIWALRNHWKQVKCTAKKTRAHGSVCQ